MSTNDAVFRVHKRKKILKRRSEIGNEPQTHPEQVTALLALGITDTPQVLEHDAHQNQSEQSLPRASDSDGQLMLSEIIRRRRTAQPRRGGIEFSNTTHAQCAGTNARDEGTFAVVEKPNMLEIASKRFAPQTGQVTQSTDQHMTAYIESEMAKIRAGRSYHEEDEHHSIEPLSKALSGGVRVPQRQPAALGQIQEIDLGRDTALKNAARTEAAAKRMQNGEGPTEDEPIGKVRLGRNGKPRKKRNRRGSDDVKRDQIVEAVLKESKCTMDLYDELENTRPVDDNDQAADDVIAEQFRRDFLDAVQSRNHMRRSANSQSAKKSGKVEDKPRGPKLGGSRSARAAMHAQEKATKRK